MTEVSDPARVLNLEERAGKIVFDLAMPQRQYSEVVLDLGGKDFVATALTELNRGTGLTILLIEHVMRAVMALAGRVLVLHHGAAIAEGPPGAVMREPAVVQSYLGAEAIA